MTELPYDELTPDYRRALRQFVAADHEVALRRGLAHHAEAVQWIIDGFHNARASHQNKTGGLDERLAELEASLGWSEPTVKSQGVIWSPADVDAPLPQKVELVWMNGHNYQCAYDAMSLPDALAFSGPDEVQFGKETYPVLRVPRRWGLHVALRTTEYVLENELTGWHEPLSPRATPAGAKKVEPFPETIQVLMAPPKRYYDVAAYRIATEATRKGAANRDRYKRQKGPEGGDMIPVALADYVAQVMGKVDAVTVRRALIRKSFRLPEDLRLALRPRPPRTG